MMQGKLLQLARCIFSLLVIADVTLSDPPDNPCPQLFQYKFDGSDWLGLIELNNIKVNQIVNIIVKLSIPTKLPSDYKGRLNLLEEKQMAVQSILQSKPLFYKITFPLKNPIPRITEIVVDNAVLCMGPPDQSPQTTRFQLYHVFYPNKNSDVGEAFNEQMSAIISSGPKATDVDCGAIQPINGTQFWNEGSTKKGEWPWLAGIFIIIGPTLTFQCGGTLLTSKVTVTAAHCFFREGQRDPVSSNEVFSAVGRYNINNWAETGSEFLPTERIEFPPNFIKTYSYEMDIAVVIHIKPVEFGNYPLIRPICLWSGSGNLLEIEGRIGTVVGWERGAKQTQHLPKLVQVGIVSRETCIRVNTQLEVVTADTNFCAAKRESKGPCPRYSGSGLVLANNGRWELRGMLVGAIVKLGTTPNCYLDEYAIFVDIFAFKDWILKMMTI